METSPLLGPPRGGGSVLTVLFITREEGWYK